jgi:hypothetical protein
MSKAIKAIGSIFKPKIPEAAVSRLPDPDSFASKLAARDKVRERREKRGGRDSTIYSGQSYTGSNLGGTA